MKTTIKLIITIAAMVISFASNAQVITNEGPIQKYKPCTGTFESIVGIVDAEIVSINNNNMAVYDYDRGMIPGGRPGTIKQGRIDSNCYYELTNKYGYLSVGTIIQVEIIFVYAYILGNCNYKLIDVISRPVGCN